VARNKLSGESFYFWYFFIPPKHKYVVTLSRSFGQRNGVVFHHLHILCRLNNQNTHCACKYVPTNWNKTEINSFKTVLKLFCFSQNKTVRPRNISDVVANHSRYQLFVSKASGWGQNDGVYGYRLWLASTAKSFPAVMVFYFISFWLKQNSIETVYFYFVSVSFQLCGELNSSKPAWAALIHSERCS